jgi:hypothetical protein
MFGLMLLGASIVCALTAYFIKPARLFISGMALLLCGVANGVIFSDRPTVWGLIALCFGTYQIFNIARLTKSRLHAKHLKLAFFVGGSRLLAAQLIFVAIGELSLRYVTFESSSVLALRYIQVFVAFILAGVVVARLVKSRPRKIDIFKSDSELPSISVLIPARNEDRNLEELLRALVANDYPKMEIIVLDDCSTTSRIPEIVKGFAHDGVRFVQGSEPRENWLAKNQAYETLVENASGDYLIFMGVDVRLGSNALRSLVNYAFSTSSKMVSVMPSRFDPAFWKGFFTPLRNMRELLRIGARFRSVPTLSTLWMIEKDELMALGGIGAVARKVIPEQYFARQLALNNTYSFVRTSSSLQISTAKVLTEQLATTIRVTYPGQHRRLEKNVVSNIALFVFVFLPYAQLIHALMYGEWLNAILSGVAALALTTAHLAIITVTNPILWPLAVVNLPYLALQEIVLNVISMYRYEFGEVYWKGRNICLPVMQVIPHLPPLDDDPKD